LFTSICGAYEEIGPKPRHAPFVSYTGFQMDEGYQPPQRAAEHRGYLMISLCSAAPCGGYSSYENCCIGLTVTCL
jgi:hypothetical protein